MISLTSATWDLIFATLFISSGCWMQYSICSFNLGLQLTPSIPKIDIQKIIHIEYASPKTTHKWIVELAACSSTSATSKATATLLFFGIAPKFLVKAIGDSQVCLPFLIAFLKILLDAIQECKWNLPPDTFISNNKICYNQFQHIPMQFMSHMEDTQMEDTIVNMIQLSVISIMLLDCKLLRE